MRPIFDSQVRTLVAARLFRGVDLIFLSSLGMGVFSLAILGLFGHLGALKAMATLLALNALLLLWLVALVYRVGYLTLLCRADVNLQTEAVARLVARAAGALPQP